MKGILSFLIVLFLMPLGHGMMILMEHFLPPTPLHYAAFAMGFVGLLLAIRGVFAEGDTRQTLFGLIGALLFWTGWVEFLFLYYAQRFGTHPELSHGIVSTTTTYAEGVASTVMHINGTLVENLRQPGIKPLVLTRPEYLIMPTSFGFWAMFMLIYVFSIRTGCDFLNWIQRHLFAHNRQKMVFRPMTRHVSIVTFMEFNLIMWSCYLLLMFCYDPVFLGDHNPVTLAIGLACAVGGVLMLRRLLRIRHWGRALRFAIATVIVIWTPVEILGRMNVFNEIWVDPLHHILEMSLILAAFIGLCVALLVRHYRLRRNTTT